MKNTDDLLKELSEAKNIEDFVSSNKANFVDIEISKYLEKLLKQKRLKMAYRL